MKNDKRLKNKNILALDIGTKTTKLAVGKFSGGKLSIKKTLSIEMPEACVSNGRISNVSKLASTLSHRIKEEKIKEKHVIVNIMSSSIINRELSIPYNENPKELDKIIGFEMRQFSTIHMEEYITQYQIIEEFYEDKMKMYRVLVTSIEKEIVESYLSLIKEMGLKPYVMDVQFNAVRKFFDAYDVSSDDSKTIAVIDFGFDGTGITILENGNYRMSRTIERGYNVLENVLEKDFELEFNNENLVKVFSDEESKSKTRLQDLLDIIISEINDIIRYHISRDRDNTVDHILLTGDLIDYEPITQYMEKQIGIKQFNIEEAKNITIGQMDDFDIPKFINVLGSIVRK